MVSPLPTQCCWQFIYGLLKKLLDGDMMTGCGLVDGLHLVNVFVQFQRVLLSTKDNYFIKKKFVCHCFLAILLIKQCISVKVCYKTGKIAITT